MNFGKAIRKYRQAAKLSQRELAAAINVTPTYISHLEAGRSEPSLKLVRDISQTLKVPDEILFWESVDIPESASKRDREVCQLALDIVASWKYPKLSKIKPSRA